MTKPADWKTYDEFALGIATNRLAVTDALDGQPLALDFGPRRLTLTLTGGAHNWTDGGRNGSDWAEAIEVAPSIFFIDRLDAGRPEISETIILSLSTGRTLSILSEVRPAGVFPGEPQVAQLFTPGQISGRTPTGPEPAPTRDLLGLRAHFTYSPSHVYQHTYLSSQRYAWQNLVGVQRGHGDVDMASTWKFDDPLYVFTFREFKIPVAATFFYNLSAMRSTGKFLGIDGQGLIVNSPAGAHIRFASMTYYLPGQEPV